MIADGKQLIQVAGFTKNSLLNYVLDGSKMSWLKKQLVYIQHFLAVINYIIVYHISFLIRHTIEVDR